MSCRASMAKRDRLLTLRLDVPQAVTVVSVLDDGGRTLETVKIRGGSERVVEWIGGLGDDTHVCFEASVSYGRFMTGSLGLASA